MAIKLRFDGVIKEVIRSDKMSDKLLPCPFCPNGIAEKERIFMIGWAIKCKSCGASSPVKDRLEDAIVAWNTRAPVKRVIGRLIDEGIPFPSEDYDIGYSDGLSCAIKIVKEEME
jgi:hypothetical protein